MGGLNDLVEVGTLGLVDDITGEKAAQDAANAGIAANDKASARLDRQYDQTRSDLMPFLEAATGNRTQYNNTQNQLNSIADKFMLNERDQIAAHSPGLNSRESVLAALAGGDMGQGWNERWGSQMGEVKKLQDQLAGYGDPSQLTDGALGDYQSGLNQQPDAPTLEGFNFDVNAAMDSPELAFQREFGEQQMDRVSAQNRQLGSGNRLYDVTRFGQGLAAQSLGDQYNRQANTYGMNQNTDLKNYSLQNDKYNTRMNRLAGLIDVGRGSGSAMGTMGAQNASSVAGLMQNTGQLQGSAAMAGYNGINNLLNMGASVAGSAMGAGGGGTGMAAGGGYGSISPIGAQDSKGFF